MIGARLGFGLCLILAGAIGLSAQARTNSTRDRTADERAIVAGEREWGQAYVTGDAETVRRLLVDDFRGVDPHGAVYDKASVLKDVTEGPHGSSDEVGRVAVRFYGDTAIAQAREHEVGPAPERKAVERVFTDTWVKIGDRWRIVAAEDLDPGAPTAAVPASDAYVQDRRVILALRAANNRALAAHDVDGAMALAADDYVTIGGDGGIWSGAAQNRKGWAEEFATPGLDRYVRTPSDVEIGLRKGVLRAAEIGRWEGIDHKSAGAARPFGRYFVHWTKASGVWRAVSETYVTLGCRGPGC